MDLEYYLLRKSVYESDIYNNECILFLLEDKLIFLHNSTSELNDQELNNDEVIIKSELNDEEVIIIKTEIQNLLIQKKNIIENLNICREKVILLCDHDFVKDDIEISPDNCVCIEYCKKCDYTIYTK